MSIYIYLSISALAHHDVLRVEVADRLEELAHERARVLLAKGAVLDQVVEQLAALRPTQEVRR